VNQVLQRHQATPGSLTLELTETMLMGRLDAALRTMASLRASGVRFSIDDFGTGYSSLSYLGRLPIDSLKIDRSFVTGMQESRQNLEIVRAMLTLGRTLGHKVIAEGVETEDQLATLRELGVHEGRAICCRVQWARTRSTTCSPPRVSCGSGRIGPEHLST
jgi:EAL domain-containing protein (putative c-di-GMP-specific phosphodiesterase class I)